MSTHSQRGCRFFAQIVLQHEAGLPRAPQSVILYTCVTHCSKHPVFSGSHILSTLLLAKKNSKKSHTQEKQPLKYKFINSVLHLLLTACYSFLGLKGCYIVCRKRLYNALQVSILQ